MKNDDFAKSISLGNEIDERFEVSKEEEIKYRKKVGKLIGDSRKAAKKKHCYYCNDDCNSFCNSHSIPAFILNNIAVNGEVYNNNKIVSIPLADDESGVNKTGTFHLICRKCDSEIFSEYENPDNYKNEPTDKMIAQIAMKNYLKSISKRELEMSIYTNMQGQYSLPESIYDMKQEINDIDLREYINDFKKTKEIIEKNWKNEYYMFFYHKLDYVVPLAFQSNVSLITDLEGNLVNDIYNNSDKYKLSPIHICVFPFENSSILIMFIESNDKRNRKFYKQFKKLSLNEKLKAINFIIFSLSEDVYMSKTVDKSVLENPKFKEVCAKTPEIQSPFPIENPQKIACENFNFNQMHEIPNLLDVKYKVICE